MPIPNMHGMQEATGSNPVSSTTGVHAGRGDRCPKASITEIGGNRRKSSDLGAKT